MSASLRAIADLLERDPRFKLEAYQFIREALAYAHDVLRLHESGEIGASAGHPRHITGQQLCEACRLYAIEQYGYLAKLVLNSWGLYETSDFGEIVYNLIEIEQMRKSENDQKEDFENAFSFEDGFEPQFVVVASEDA
jgi:uncharacterized repeat protein (TIGR04138 family)